MASTRAIVGQGLRNVDYLIELCYDYLDLSKADVTVAEYRYTPVSWLMFLFLIPLKWLQKSHGHICG